MLLSNDNGNGNSGSDNGKKSDINVGKRGNKGSNGKNGAGNGKDKANNGKNSDKQKNKDLKKEDKDKKKEKSKEKKGYRQKGKYNNKGKHKGWYKNGKIPVELPELQDTKVDVTYYLNDVSDPLTQVLMTYGVDGNYDAAYTYGLERINVEDIDETRPESQDPLYYLYDGLGSTTYLVKPDGNKRDHCRYDEYGKPAPGNSKLSPDGAINLNNTFGYTGEMWDEETDLLYLRARYYEPETGRFLSRDTYEGELGNPLSRHLYAYVQNNPVNRIDPSGRMPVWMLNTISWGYNNRAFFGDWDASLAVFLGNVIDPGRHTSLYVPFHEIAQINIARYLHNLTGGKNEIILEKSIGTGEYYKRFGVIKTEKLYEADIVMGRQVWEVKPISGKDPKPQLELYKKKGGLTPSNILVGHTISGITVFDELKMKITFPRPGEARYELYFDSGNGTIETITTVAAAKWLIKLLPKLIGSGGRRLMPVR